MKTLTPVSWPNSKAILPAAPKIPTVVFIETIAASCLRRGSSQWKMKLFLCTVYHLQSTWGSFCLQRTSAMGAMIILIAVPDFDQTVNPLISKQLATARQHRSTDFSAFLKELKMI